MKDFSLINFLFEWQDFTGAIISIIASVIISYSIFKIEEKKVTKNNLEYLHNAINIALSGFQQSYANLYYLLKTILPNQINLLKYHKILDLF